MGVEIQVPASFAENFRRVAELAGWGPEVLEEERTIVRSIIERGPEAAKDAFDTFAWLRSELEREHHHRDWKTDYTLAELQAQARKP